MTKQLREHQQALDDSNPCKKHQTPLVDSTSHRRARIYPMSISLPLRHREVCATPRALLAAIREADFDEWQASGGDYLRHNYQPAQ